MKKMACASLLVLLCGGGLYIISRSPIWTSNPRVDRLAGSSIGLPSPPGRSNSQNIFVAYTNTPKLRSGHTEFLEKIIENWADVPDLSALNQITSEEKRLLVEAYRKEPNLLKRRSLTIALGFGDVEEAIEVFKHTLTDELKGRKLSSIATNAVSERDVMLTTLEMLGRLANKYESAYSFVKKGMDPQFWQRNAQWTSEYLPDQFGILASRSITAVGMSGRPDVSETLNSLKELPLVNTADDSVFRRSLEGAVVDAAFWNDLIQENGMEYIKKIYGREIIFYLFNNWASTANGRRWEDWSQERRQAAKNK